MAFATYSGDHYVQNGIVSLEKVDLTFFIYVVLDSIIFTDNKYDINCHSVKFWCYLRW